jgi:hypothetical protein
MYYLHGLFFCFIFAVSILNYYIMTWDYSLSTNTIWTSFDCGHVEADTYEEAKELALKQLKYDVDKANTVFDHCDITQGFKLEMDYTQLEVTLANPQPLPVAPEPETLPLTKFSERNLNVIKNFLLYAGLEDDYMETANNYIAEDHVDGEDSPQAIRELALSSELIREDVDISNSLADGYNIYANHITGLIYAVNMDDENATLYVYKLIKPQEVIEVEHRDEILDYCLSVKTKEDEVCLGDIFVHGKYVELISEV